MNIAFMIIVFFVAPLGIGAALLHGALKLLEILAGRV